jgi:hypothetical protein
MCPKIDVMERGKKLEFGGNMAVVWKYRVETQQGSEWAWVCNYYLIMD